MMGKDKISNDYKPEVGEIYSFEHGDYRDYLVCFEINQEKNYAALLGIDDGAALDSVYIFMVDLDLFFTKFKWKPFFWEKTIDKYSVYCQNMLIEMIEYIYLGKISLKKTNSYFIDHIGVPINTIPTDIRIKICRLFSKEYLFNIIKSLIGFD